MRVRVLTFRYVGALLIVAGLLVAGQTVIHQLLGRQEGDAQVINLAGRQRMLGQRLCTLMLALGVDTGERARDTREQLMRLAGNWERTHAALRDGSPETGLHGGNSPAIRALFAQIEPDHRAMLAAARTAVALPVGRELAAYAEAMRVHQDAFLAGMDRIVAEYEREARQRITGLRRLELMLLGLALLVFGLEGVFVFWPAVSDLRLQLAERAVVQRTLDASEAGRRVAQRQLLQIGEREQVRLAQDLHDGLGQHLIGVSFLLQALRPQLAGGPAAQLDDIDRLVGEAIEQTRDLVRSLHSRTLEAAGLTAALAELAAHIARVFRVECRVDDRAELAPSAASRTHLYRIAREAVLNAARHARATAIAIELRRDGGELVLEVSDDGVGISAPPSAGMGLHLMAHRAHLLGATLQITAGLRGTTVTCRVPVSEIDPPDSPGGPA
jgi:signal transduction histidine kinase